VAKSSLRNYDFHSRAGHHRTGSKDQVKFKDGTPKEPRPVDPWGLLTPLMTPGNNGCTRKAGKDENEDGEEDMEWAITSLKKNTTSRSGRLSKQIQPPGDPIW
jgi:hypothetical protein